MFSKRIDTNNKGLMYFFKKNGTKDDIKKEQLNNILNGAKDLLKENKSVKYRSLHPVFSYIKIFTDLIQNKSASNILKYGRDNILYKNEYFNIVDAYLEPLLTLQNKVLYDKDSYENNVYMPKELLISNARSPIITTIWNSERIIDNIKSIGDGIIIDTYITRENSFIEDSTNHRAIYLYPMGVTYVYNGNHSIFSGMNKGEGHFHVEKIIDMSELYSKYHFDGKYLINKETNEREEIFFEIGVLIEIGRLLINHPEVFPVEVRKHLQ